MSKPLQTEIQDPKLEEYTPPWIDGNNTQSTDNVSTNQSLSNGYNFSGPDIEFSLLETRYNQIGIPEGDRDYLKIVFDERPPDGRYTLTEQIRNNWSAGNTFGVDNIIYIPDHVDGDNRYNQYAKGFSFVPIDNFIPKLESYISDTYGLPIFSYDINDPDNNVFTGIQVEKLFTGYDGIAIQVNYIVENLNDSTPIARFRIESSYVDFGDNPDNYYSVLRSYITAYQDAQSLDLGQLSTNPSHATIDNAEFINALATEIFTNDYSYIEFDPSYITNSQYPLSTQASIQSHQYINGTNDGRTDSRNWTLYDKRVAFVPNIEFARNFETGEQIGFSYELGAREDDPDSNINFPIWFEISDRNVEDGGRQIERYLAKASDNSFDVYIQTEGLDGNNSNGIFFDSERLAASENNIETAAPPTPYSEPPHFNIFYQQTAYPANISSSSNEEGYVIDDSNRLLLPRDNRIIDGDIDGNSNNITPQQIDNGNTIVRNVQFVADDGTVIEDMSNNDSIYPTIEKIQFLAVNSDIVSHEITLHDYENRISIEKFTDIPEEAQLSLPDDVIIRDTLSAALQLEITEALEGSGLSADDFSVLMGIDFAGSNEYIDATTYRILPKSESNLYLPNILR